jgi:hypothetical protein
MTAGHAHGLPEPPIGDTDAAGPRISRVAIW